VIVEKLFSVTEMKEITRHSEMILDKWSANKLTGPNHHSALVERAVLLIIKT
jgi:hypothetical protein